MNRSKRVWDHSILLFNILNSPVIHLSEYQVFIHDSGRQKFNVYEQYTFHCEPANRPASFDVPVFSGIPAFSLSPSHPNKM